MGPYILKYSFKSNCLDRQESYEKYLSRALHTRVGLVIGDTETVVSVEWW